MNSDVKKIYINLIKYKKSPKHIFQDWNRVREVANLIKYAELSTGKILYPEYIRMLMRYRVGS